MTTPDKDEVVSIVLAIEECAKEKSLGLKGMSFLAVQAARVIRGLRPDLAYEEADNAVNK